MREILFSLLLPMLGQAWGAVSLTARDIVDRANKALRGDSSHAVLTMTVVAAGWTRRLEIEGFNAGRRKALIVVHSPAKDKGTATLRIQKEMWLWNPKVERVIKIPPTMMHSSWMGSDFTYEDIVKADSIVKDYTYRVLSSNKAEGWDEYRIEALPKPDAPVVWGRVSLEGRIYPDGSVVPTREDDYSERGELIRTIELSDIQNMGGRLIPIRLTCIPRRKSGQKTVLEYHRIDFDAEFPGDFFSLSRLQRP